MRLPSLVILDDELMVSLGTGIMDAMTGEVLVETTGDGRGSGQFGCGRGGSMGSRRPCVASKRACLVRPRMELTVAEEGLHGKQAGAKKCRR